MTAIPLPVTPWFSRPETGISSALADPLLQTETRDTSLTGSVRLERLLCSVRVAADAAKASNWDGEGARAVDATTVRYARMFAELLPPTLPLPDVSADRDGDIS